MIMIHFGRATAFSSFLLLGFLEIGAQMYANSNKRAFWYILISDSENPFDYDANDLDLDQLCLTIQRELNEICAVSKKKILSFFICSTLKNTHIYSIHLQTILHSFTQDGINLSHPPIDVQPRRCSRMSNMITTRWDLVSGWIVSDVHYSRAGKTSIRWHENNTGMLKNISISCSFE